MTGAVPLQPRREHRPNDGLFGIETSRLFGEQPNQLAYQDALRAWIAAGLLAEDATPG
jgi:hypothetical protein